MGLGSRTRRGTRPLRRAGVAWAAVLGAALFGATGAAASHLTGTQQSVLLQKNLCQTTYGGSFVDIPTFPGERIDSRLLEDVEWMMRRYKLFVTDGYATSGHAPNGEHPIGLALDVIPNTAIGGTWRKVAKLARRAEPVQNQPRPPFRWVGWNGDAGHGRGHHLHLSWMHSPTQPSHPAQVVYTRICPEGSPIGPTPPTRELNETLQNLPYEGPQHDDPRG
jgi:hypothetical protein